MTDTKLAELRKPFPPEQIGKLPKGGQMLDFVGHADVTDRLLSCDPAWTWEPLGYTPEGLPALDRFGNLWIKLTVCGVTRIGVGDGKSMKECISDALRNAAMRFGVALDLWAKGDRHFGLEGHDAPMGTQTVGGVRDDLDPARLTRTRGNPGPDEWTTDPLKDIKAKVWAAARAIGLDQHSLPAHYAEATGGLVLADADETSLRAYLETLEAV